MADNTIRFMATTLPAGKQGVLKPDSNGYYTVVLGGLDAINAIGEIYVLKEVERLFTANSSFMRRVKEGCLKMEVGHPAPQPGQRREEFFSRVDSIDPKNVCGFIAEVWLDYDNFRNPDGSKMVAIMGKVCPSGPQGAMLKASLEQPGENVCFSIRSFTEDYVQGARTYRIIRKIVTFDFVVEPGIYNAKKFRSPALESLCDYAFSHEQLQKIINAPILEGVGMESANLSKQTARELMVSRGALIQEYGKRKTGWEGW